jgi:hypothetical protein
MTISSTTVKNSYNGDGSTATFTYTFKIFADSDLQVIIRSALGTETVKTLTTHYTVTGAGSASGGDITFTAGNIPVSGETVVLRRAIPQTQAIDYIANDPFPAESHEEGLDRATMAIQQLQEEVDRSIKLSRTNTITSSEFTVGAANRANKVLAFDASGELSVAQELGQFQGNWSAGETFAQRDLVKDTSNNNIYICLTAHTSSGSLPISSNADVAKWSLIVDAASATASASAAAASATASANSASASASSASTATTQATNASNSATAAASSASSASTSASNAASSEAAAAAIFDNFDDSYLGPKASNPTVDNDGDPLQDGALYFDTTNNVMKVYDLGTTTWFQLTPTVSNQTNINTVAGISADVTAVAADATDIGTVASNLSGTNTIGTVASNLIGTNTIGTVAGSIANVNEVANNIGTVNNFGDRYRVQAGEPSVNNDEGDLVYDTTANAVKVYNGTSFDTIQQGITDTAPTRHSIRPSLNLDFANSKVLDPRITFTRASNATYYDGYTSVKAEENLLEYSQEFDNADWIKQRTSVTANNTTAPDGTTTADTLVENTDTASHNIYDSFSHISGKVYTHSIFAKANGRTKLFLAPQASSTIASVGYDLTAVTSTLNSGTVISHNITDVGNGWYRCSVTFTATGNGGYFQLNILDATGTSSYTGDGSSGLHLWGAQLEQRDSLTAYTPTTSSPITKYQPALQTAGNNVARFDHNPTTGESLGLLIEESRINKFAKSETLNTWSTVNSPIIRANQTIAPDGNLTADKYIVPDGTTSGNTSAYQSSTITANATFTVSIYAKSAGLDNFSFFIRDNAVSANSFNAYFDLSNGTTSFTGNTGTATFISSSIVDVGNGWYRCIATGSIGNSATTIQSRLINRDAGNGFDGYFFWGMQVEEGSFPTSYIKTTGSQVTRSADYPLMTDITDWYKISEGTIYSEAHKFSGSLSSTIFEFNDNSLNNRYSFIYVTDTALRFRSIAYGTNDSNITQTVSSSEYTKASGIYRLNDFDFVTSDINIVGSDISARIPININRFTIGTTNNAFNSLNGHIKKIAYYPIALTDNEITDLTEE